MDEDAFDADSNLLKELIQHEGFQGKSLGIVLTSGNNKFNASFAEEAYWYEQIGQVCQWFTAMT